MRFILWRSVMDVSMCSTFKYAYLLYLFVLCSASYHEQYRVPHSSSDKWESYIYDNKEYLVQNLPVNWENARILCRGYHNGSLAVLDTRDKAEFLAEALSESQFGNIYDVTEEIYFDYKCELKETFNQVTFKLYRVGRALKLVPLTLPSVWVGARRDSAEDPSGYRWGAGLELRRTALDVLPSEREGNTVRRYPVWLNRTHVPVPESGADCVALERVHHDSPVFLDLPCHLERPFACEREAQASVQVREMSTVRCRTGLYHIYGGRSNWHQAAAHCVLKGMALANIGTAKCLRRLGMSMLKIRPSIENAWIGARGTLGRWTWIDSGVSIFQPPPYLDVQPAMWPPMRDRSAVKQSGCLQLDRHSAHPPVFLEARCERKMQFICYQGVPALRALAATPSDDLYYYVLVKQLFYWQHAYENCLKINGTLASLDNNDILIQLLLVMGENKEESVDHIWISGRLNMSKDVLSDAVTYSWYNPVNQKRIPDPKTFGDTTSGIYMAPWLDEEFTMDNPCLNLDRQDHLLGLVYGLPCDTPQYSVCMIEKSTKPAPETITDSSYTTSL